MRQLTIIIRFEPLLPAAGPPKICSIVKHPLTWFQQRKRAASENSATAPTDSAPPEVTPAVEAPAAPAAETPKIEEAPKPVEAAKPAQEAKPAEPAAAKAPWTAAEDVALLSLKAQNKPWKDIGDVLMGRDKDELRARYKEIGPGESVEAQKAPAAAQANGGAAQANVGKAKNGKQKGEGGKKGKGKGEWNKENEKQEGPPEAGTTTEPLAAAAPTPEAPPAHPGAWPGEPSVPNVAHNEAVAVNEPNSSIKGVLKRDVDGGFRFDNVAVPEGATTLNGCPIIYVDESDPLDINDVSVH